MSEQSLTLSKETLPSVPSEQLDELAKELGVIKMPVAGMKMLHELGLRIQQSGLVTFVNGEVVFTMVSMHSAIMELNKRIHKKGQSIETLQKLTQALGYLSGHIARAGAGIVKTEQAGKAAEEEKDLRRRKSFVPHAIISGNNVQVNVHPPKETPAPVTAIAKPVEETK